MSKDFVTRFDSGQREGVFEGSQCRSPETDASGNVVVAAKLSVRLGDDSAAYFFFPAFFDAQVEAKALYVALLGDGAWYL